MEEWTWIQPNLLLKPVLCGGSTTGAFADSHNHIAPPEKCAEIRTPQDTKNMCTAVIDLQDGTQAGICVAIVELHDGEISQIRGARCIHSTQASLVSFFSCVSSMILPNGQWQFVVGH